MWKKKLKRNDAVLQIRLPSWQLSELAAAAKLISKYELGGRKLPIAAFVRMEMNEKVQDTFLKYGEPEAEDLQGRHEE